MEGPITGDAFIDWSLLTVSLFNAIVLVWLGLTVLLNAERRTWAIWMAGAGLLLGSVFFVSHSALLAQGLEEVTRDANFWWHTAWTPVIAAPLAWYVAMLWYAGFWEDRQGALHRRQRPWLVLVVLMVVGILGLALFANPLPTFTQVWNLEPLATPTVGGIPLLILVYSLYPVVCICLSLDALRHPGPTARMMGALARQRARPWLMATSVVLLLVSVLVAWTLMWLVWKIRKPPSYTEVAVVLLSVDLMIASLIAVAVVLLGQGIVSYEVFTGKTLPRHGFRRQWYSALLLAAGYAAVVGWSLALRFLPIYGLLLTTLLMTASYALFGWRSFLERERAMRQLRPFITSQRLYDHLLKPSTSAPSEVELETPFYAMCAEVLSARVAYLVSLGPLAPLVGPPLAYPNGIKGALPSLTEVTAQFTSPQTMCAPIDPERFGGAMWAVPLWSERGLVGALLLGEKSGGGLYTQEEIEIARATGERLIDTQASAAMAQRLMALQRQRMSGSQVLDRRTRRVLHDDILPQLHTAMLALSVGRGSLEGVERGSLGGVGHGSPGGVGRGSPDPARGTTEGLPASEDLRPAVPERSETCSEHEVLAHLGAVHRRLSDLLHEMPTSTAPELARLGLLGALKLVVEEELAGAFDGVTWHIEPEADRAAQALPPLTAEVLFYAAREALRNAARHSRGSDASRALHLGVAVKQRDGLEVLVEDDGVGMDAIAPPEGSGGQGLALHGTMMAVVGGSLVAESRPGGGTRVTLMLPRGAMRE